MDQILLEYGLPGVIILVLGSVVLYQERSRQKVQDKLEGIQEQRLNEAKETRDKLTEPLDKVADLSQRMYDLLLTSKRGR